MNEHSKTIAPYGSWISPFTPDAMIAGITPRNSVSADNGIVYWLERRLSEGGRQVIMMKAPKQDAVQITPTGFNVRSRVHEYGGGAYTVHGGVVYFVNCSDQQIWVQNASFGAISVQLTKAEGSRFTDLHIDTKRNRIICVHEDHGENGAEPKNTLVGVSLVTGVMETIAEGADFYSSPAFSHDGNFLAWISWNHPNMPWDTTMITVRDLRTGKEDWYDRYNSIAEPCWNSHNKLYFVSDDFEWWNIYELQFENGTHSPVLGFKDFPMKAEFTFPHWGFGDSHYIFLPSGEIVCAYTAQGIWNLGIIENSALRKIEAEYTEISDLHALSPTEIVFLGSSPTKPSTIVLYDTVSGEFEELSDSSIPFDVGYISTPTHFSFPTGDGEEAYGFFYPPANKDYEAPEGELPPCVVSAHSGPTASAGTSFTASLQYWTSRGFAVLDVNYRGSTGYGRVYRQKLYGRWGVVDVEDCIAGVKYLVEAGHIDPNRVVIRGSSAGGLTVLNALVASNVFKAGASHYGVADMEALAQDTHKFESRYMEKLVAPYPEQAGVYQERSPLHKAEQIEASVIFFQGLDDHVVPSNQARTMVQALREKGIGTVHIEFEGEGHGFRDAKNLKKVMNSELHFYARIFGFPVDAGVIENSQEIMEQLG